MCSRETRLEDMPRIENRGSYQLLVNFTPAMVADLITRGLPPTVDGDITVKLEDIITKATEPKDRRNAK